MALGSISKGDSEDDLSEEFLNKHSESDEDSFLEGMKEIELPVLELPDTQAGGKIDLSAISEFKPDEPQVLADALVKDDNSVEAQLSTTSEMSDATFKAALSAAIDSGLAPEAAKQIETFCLNGLAKREALLIVGYALNGIDLKQITQLALMGIGGRSAAEIKHQADTFLQDLNGGMSISEPGNVEKSGANRYPIGMGSKLRSGLSTLLGGIGARMGMVGGSQANIANQGKTSRGWDDPEDGKIEKINDSNTDDENVEASAKAVQEKLMQHKNVSDDAKLESFSSLKQSLASFEDTAKRRLGAAKTIEEASTIFGMIKGLKTQLASDCAEFLSKEENSGLKDFFKMFDNQLKKMFNAIKSQFISTEKLKGMEETSSMTSTANLEA